MAIPMPAVRRTPNGKKLVVTGAREHNLKDIEVEIPLGLLTVVTGVSGSGKSTLINEIFIARWRAKSTARAKSRARTIPSKGSNISTR